MQILMANEGFEPKVYQIQGVPHIGFGYNLKSRMTNPPCADYKCLLWSKADAFYQLEDDVRQIDRRLSETYGCYDRLPINAKLVMLDLTFNVGVAGAMKFEKLIIAVCLGQYEDASEHLLNSKYASDVPHRARRNSKILTEGYNLK